MNSRVKCLAKARLRAGLKGRRGQSSIEYLFVIISLLIIVLPLGYLSITHAQSESSVAQAKIAVNKISSSSDKLHALGEGSFEKVVIDLPDGISANGTFVSGKEINFRLITGDGDKDVFTVSQGNVSGTLPSAQGTHVMTMTLTNGIVIISEATS